MSETQLERSVLEAKEREELFAIADALGGVELPADCPASDVDQFGVWQSATASWFPGFYGTPNAANTDVQCP